MTLYILARWTDNNVITMASKIHCVHPIKSFQRYTPVQRKVIDVECLNSVSMYSKHMGRTDQMDQNVVVFPRENVVVVPLHMEC